MCFRPIRLPRVRFGVLLSAFACLTACVADDTEPGETTWELAPAADAGVGAGTRGAAAREVELTGTFYPLGDGDDFPDSRDPRDAQDHGPTGPGMGPTGLFEVRGGGLVRLRFPGSVTLARGTTLQLRGRVHSDTNTVDVVELLATRPPSDEARSRLRADEASRAEDGREQLRYQQEQEADALLPLAPGALQMLIIPYFCDPSQTSAGPASPTPADFTTLVNGTITPWMKATSWLHRTYQATTLPWTNVCTVPSLVGPPFTGHTPEEAALAIHGTDANLYDRVVLVSDTAVAYPTGAAESLPGRRMVVYGASLELGLWLHELGHLEGLFHAHALRCTSPTSMYSLPSTCASHGFNDLADSMSWSFVGDPTSQYSSAQADALGWLGPNNIKTVTTSGYVDITAYAEPIAVFPMRAVKVPLASGTLYIEQRRGAHNDAGLAAHAGMTNGVLLRVHGASIDSSPTIESYYANPQLLDGNTSTTHWADAALPYGTTFYTPEGVSIRAQLMGGGITRVHVKFPTAVRISQPRNVRARALPGTGTALVEWDPPTMQPPGTSYQVAAYPSLTILATTATSAIVGGLADGSNAFAVRALAPGHQSEFVGSNVLWEYALPTAAASPLSVPEPPSGTVNVGVSLTLPYLPFGAPVSRAVGSVAQGVGPGFADAGDFLPGGSPVSFASTTASTSVSVHQDSQAEPLERFDLVVIDQVCAPLFMLNGCVVPRRLVDVEIPAN